MSKLLITGIVLAFVSLAVWSRAGEQDVVQSLVKSGQNEEAYRVLKGLAEKESNDSARALHYFGLGALAFRLGQLDQVEPALMESIRLGTQLEDHAYAILGKTFRLKGDLDKSKDYFLKLEKFKPKLTPLYHDAEFELGEIAIKKEQWKVAHDHFAYLEKKLRRDERYPAIIFNLMRVELARQKKWLACKWATKLYSKIRRKPLNNFL